MALDQENRKNWQEYPTFWNRDRVHSVIRASYERTGGTHDVKREEHTVNDNIKWIRSRVKRIIIQTISSIDVAYDGSNVRYGHGEESWKLHYNRCPSNGDADKHFNQMAALKGLLKYLSEKSGRKPFDLFSELLREEVVGEHWGTTRFTDIEGPAIYWPPKSGWVPFASEAELSRQRQFDLDDDFLE